MNFLRHVLYLVAIACLFACNRGNAISRTGHQSNADPVRQVISRPASIGIIGDTADIIRSVGGGLVLMGGSTDVDAAFQWIIDRSGGGDVVVIRASGTDAYNPYIHRLGMVNSVETLKIDSRDLANNDTVAAIIRQAEMLFIAGGDQSNYMRFWKDTKTEAAINYLLSVKKAPVGGTSAGCAIMGGFYYSGENGSATSAEALQDPYAANISLYKHDFLRAPFLQHVITDQHYLARNREGRSVVFLGRILKDWKMDARIIAVDERTAVCIDQKGKAQVFGLASASRPYSYAYFIKSNKTPERLEPGHPLHWNQGHQALEVYEIQASEKGNGLFDVAGFSLKKSKGGKTYWWWVDKGILQKQLKNTN